MSINFQGIEIHNIWDFKEIAKAVKKGATKTELTPLIDESSSNFDNIMDQLILECRGWPYNDGDFYKDKGGAFGCAVKQDVLYLLDQGIIGNCQSDRSLSVAHKQYLRSQSDDSYYFNFEDWATVCNFTEEQITSYTGHDEL